MKNYGKFTLMSSFLGTSILNNLSSAGESGLLDAVVQEEIPDKTAPIIKTAADIGFIITHMP